MHSGKRLSLPYGDKPPASGIWPSLMRLCLGTVGRWSQWLAVAALTLMLDALGRSAEADTSISVFGGLLTDNPWEEVVLLPWKIDLQRPGLVGIAAAYPLGTPIQLRHGTLDFAVEGQVVRHFGLQRHWEFNLPLSVGLTPRRRILSAIDRVAFGMGLSYATYEPALEMQRGRGRVEQTLIYWNAEVERHLDSRPGNSIFFRLHHRSDGFGLIGDGGSSNGLVFGLRRRF